MDPFTVLIVISFLYCGLLFIDTIFRSCSHYPYLHFLKNTGITVEAFKIGWFTTAFNRTLQRWGSLRPKLLDWWFCIGKYFSLVLLPFAAFTIISSTFSILWPSHRSSNKQVVLLEPMIPGVNLPFADLGYYTFTLVVCSIFHELGHAIAAVREGVHIYGMGITVIFILPLAYVHINSEQLLALCPKKQLRILCAGVWDNVVLAIFATAISLLLPLIFYPLYDTGIGVSVQSISQNSPVLGPTGLKVGDCLSALNECPVTDARSWHQCIATAIRNPSPGYCVTTEMVAKHDASISVHQQPDGVWQCCEKDNSEHLCFEYQEKDDGIAELHQHSCLPGRIVVEEASAMCFAGEHCIEGLHCIKPLLANTTKLVRFKRANGNLVLFLGHPAEVYHTVKVSDYVPIYESLSTAIPEMVTRMCNYVAVFSAGLAMINLIPCFFFDGQHIVLSLTNLLAEKVMHKSTRRAVAFCVTILGSVFLLINVALSIYSLVFSLWR